MGQINDSIMAKVPTRTDRKYRTKTRLNVTPLANLNYDGSDT